MSTKYTRVYTYHLHLVRYLVLVHRSIVHSISYEVLAQYICVTTARQKEKPSTRTRT